MPIPRDVEKNLTNLTKEQWEIESERIMSRSLRFYSEKIEKNEELKKLINEKMNKKLNETKESDMPLAQSIIDKK
jgi:ATP-dependent helicase STH1/SNF2